MPKLCNADLEMAKVVMPGLINPMVESQKLGRKCPLVAQS
jgi:hypothetical protein